MTAACTPTGSWIESHVHASGKFRWWWQWVNWSRATMLKQWIGYFGMHPISMHLNSLSFSKIGDFLLSYCVIAMDLMSVNALLCKKGRKRGKLMCITQIEYGWAWRKLKSSFISYCQFIFQQCSSYSSHIKCPHGNFIICICPLVCCSFELYFFAAGQLKVWVPYVH